MCEPHNVRMPEVCYVEGYCGHTGMQTDQYEIVLQSLVKYSVLIERNKSFESIVFIISYLTVWVPMDSIAEKDRCADDGGISHYQSTCLGIQARICISAVLTQEMPDYVSCVVNKSCLCVFQCMDVFNIVTLLHFLEVWLRLLCVTCILWERN